MAKLQLLIEMDADTGEIAIVGSALQDKCVAYGMLELGKDAIRKGYEESDKRIVEPPPGLRLTGG